ncbi:hypothetical protein RB213_014894 [Colletotrichum asianum]
MSVTVLNGRPTTTTTTSDHRQRSVIRTPHLKVLAAMDQRCLGPLEILSDVLFSSRLRPSPCVSTGTLAAGWVFERVPLRLVMVMVSEPRPGSIVLAPGTEHTSAIGTDRRRRLGHPGNRAGTRKGLSWRRQDARSGLRTVFTRLTAPALPLPLPDGTCEGSMMRKRARGNFVHPPGHPAIPVSDNTVPLRRRQLRED